MTILVDVALATKWADALDSGDYEQTQGALHRKSGGHCCLGVLADIVQPDAWVAPLVDATVWAADMMKHPLQNGSDEYLNIYEVQFTLDVGPIEQSGEGVQGKYASMNDNSKTFAEIAAQIRTDYNIQPEGE
jgi:hypothetical protein